MATGAAGSHRDIGVVLGRQPVGKTTLVTTGAVGRCRDVVARFTSGCGAVVATGAVGGCGEAAVVHFRTAPGGGGSVAALTIGGR